MSSITKQQYFKTDIHSTGLHITVWPKMPRLLISLLHRKSFSSSGAEAVKTARALIELLTPIAEFDLSGAADRFDELRQEEMAAENDTGAPGMNSIPGDF
jgi:hypothetical protein